MRNRKTWTSNSLCNEMVPTLFHWNKLMFIQFLKQKKLSCPCHRNAFAILYCSRIFRVRHWFNLREGKTTRRCLNGTTSSFQIPGLESKIVCKVLVWLYTKLWICLVLTKNRRQKSVLYPPLQNVVGWSRCNNVWNLASLPVKQLKKNIKFDRSYWSCVLHYRMFFE